MKRRLLWALLSWLSLLSFGARAQTNVTIARETFEGLGTDYGYTSNTFGSGNTNIYFERRVFTTPTGSTTTYSGSSGAVSNQQGSYAWTGERVRGNSAAGTGTNAPNIRVPGYVQLTVPTTNYKNLRLVVAFADPHCSTCAGNTTGANDRVRLRYSFDGSPFVTAGLLVSTQTNASIPQPYSWGIDTSAPLDSVADNVLGQAYQDVTAPISGTGSSLRIQVEVDANAPEITFDNIRLIGDVDAGAKPALANLEPASNVLTYTEGQAPVQVTSSLTVGYSDNSPTNITGGTVSISSGFTSGDLLNYTSQYGITGSYSNGVLTLSGTTNQANYQAALRSITFSNSNTSTLPNGTRQVTFQLSNGTAQSNTPVRNLNVVAVLTAGTLPYTENFNSDGEGTRYFGNSFVRPANTAGFFRSTTSPAYSGSDKIGDLTYTGWSGGYWYGEGTKLISPTAGTAVQLAPINAAGASGLKFVVAVGSSASQPVGSSTVNYNWDSGDSFRLYYRTGGSSGTWTEFGSFLPDANGLLRRGGNTDSVVVGQALRYFTFPLPAQAAVNGVDFQLVQVSDLDEELAFDNIRISAQTTVTSIVRANPNPTNLATVNYTVTFGTAVTGLTASNFTLTTSGISGASVGTPTQGSGNTWTVPVSTGSGNGTLTLNLVNSTGLSYDISNLPFAGETYTIDKTAPTVSSVTGPANGTYGTGAALNFTFTFSEAVAVTGTPQLALTIGSTTRQATYVSGSGTTTLTFRYTTVSGDNDTDGIASTSPLALNGGTIRDGAGNDATLTFTPPTTTGVLVDTQAPTVTAFTSSNGASGGTTATSPLSFSVTFSESVTGFSAAGITTNGSAVSTPSGSGAGPYTFTVTPVTGAATTVTIAANAARDAANNGNTASSTYSLTYQPTVSVTAVTNRDLSPTALTQVSYTVTFSGAVTGLSTSNFRLVGTVSGASVVSVTAVSGTVYTVVANTGTGNGTLQLEVNNSTGVTPTITNVPYGGSTYTITKSFAAAPTLRIQAAGSASGNGDVTAFVDVVQVLSGGTAFANALQNASFENNNVDQSSFRKAIDPVPVAANPWSFTGTSGVSRNNSAFGSTAADGDAVALIQSAGDNNASISQNLAVPTGSSYQVRFRTIQRNYTSLDQRLNVFVNNVFVGNIQPNNSPTYGTFTSETFSVTAPALTATVSTTSSSPTSTSPIPFSVSFSQSVGTTFTASDVTVTGGTLTSGSFSGSGAGPYTFTVTPNGTGTVTVSLAANVANDANNTGNTASNSASVQYQQPVTATPVLTRPADNSFVRTNQPEYTGTTVPRAYIFIYRATGSGSFALVDTTIANGLGNFHKFSTDVLADGTYRAYVTATDVNNSLATSANSNTNTFTVDTTAPTVTLSSGTVANGGTTSTSPVQFTATFSEQVLNFSSAGIQVNGGTVTSGPTVGSGNTYTFQVTPSASGSVTVQVKANAAQDRAGNNSAASTTYSFTYSQLVTNTPVLTQPADGSFVRTNQPEYTGTTVPRAYIFIYRATGSGSFALTDTTIANGLGNFHKFSNASLPDGSYRVYVTATDVNGNRATSANSNTNGFTVDTNPPTVTLSSSTVANGGTTSTSPVQFTATFSEPLNSFASNGIFVSGGTVTSGPTQVGTTNAYAFQVTPNSAGTVIVQILPAAAKDRAGNNNSASTAYSFTFSAPTITVNPSPAANGVVGQSYTQTFSATGGSGSYTYAISGTPPTGLSFSGSTLSGTPTAGGTFNFRITATDNSASPGPYSGFRDYAVTIAAPTITLNPTTLPNGALGTFYTQNITASGGTAPYTYSLVTGSGTPPSGLTLASNGTLSGTPTVSGTFNFTVRATDASTGSGPYSGTQAYSLTIAVTTLTWNGSQGQDWNTPANWTPNQVPTASTDALIPGNVRFYPIVPVTGAATRNLTLNGPGTITQSAGTLTVNGNLTSSGAITKSAGTIAVTGDLSTSGTITQSGGDLTVTGSLSNNSGGTINAGGTLTVNGNLTNNNTFNASTGTVVLGGGSAATSILGSSAIRFYNLNVQASGVQLSTSAGATVQRLLTLNGNFTTTGNSFTLASDANGTALVVNVGSNVVNGNTTVQRYIASDLNANLGYRHVSAAVSGATISSLTTGSYSPVVNPAYNGSATPLKTLPFPTVYGYDQSRLATTTNNLNAFDKGWYSPSATSDPLNVGQGYTVLIAANQTWNFTGTLNNGDKTLNLARNSGATAANSGLAFVGNPYPSPLDWRLVGSGDRSNVDPVIYVYASNSASNPYVGTYSSYNNDLSTGTLNPPVVAQGQGFFVRVTQGTTSGTLTFKNTHRVTSYQNPVYHRTTETRPLVRLALQGVGSRDVDDAVVYFEQGATAANDPSYDAEKLSNSSGLNLSTSLSTTERMAIDGRAPLGTAQLVVPLAVGVPAVGSYTLKAAELLNLSLTPTYLRDLQTGAVIDLAAQPSYQFTVTNASALITGRFELVFSPQAPLATATAALAQQVGLYPNPATGTAFVELPASLGRQAVTATLVDAVGRQVRTVQLPAQGAVAHRLDLHELPSGVYLLHLHTSAGTLVKKLTVE